MRKGGEVENVVPEMCPLGEEAAETGRLPPRVGTSRGGRGGSWPKGTGYYKNQECNEKDHRGEHHDGGWELAMIGWKVRYLR